MRIGCPHPAYFASISFLKGECFFCAGVNHSASPLPNRHVQHCPRAQRPDRGCRLSEMSFNRGSQLAQLTALCFIGAKNARRRRELIESYPIVTQGAGLGVSPAACLSPPTKLRGPHSAGGLSIPKRRSIHRRMNCDHHVILIPCRHAPVQRSIDKKSKLLGQAIVRHLLEKLPCARDLAA